MLTHYIIHAIIITANPDEDYLAETSNRAVQFVSSTHKSF